MIIKLPFETCPGGRLIGQSGRWCSATPTTAMGRLADVALEVDSNDRLVLQAISGIDAEPPDDLFMVKGGFRHKAEVEESGKLPFNIAKLTGAACRCPVQRIVRLPRIHPVWRSRAGSAKNSPSAV